MSRMTHDLANVLTAIRHVTEIARDGGERVRAWGGMVDVWAAATLTEDMRAGLALLLKHAELPGLLEDLDSAERAAQGAGDRLERILGDLRSGADTKADPGLRSAPPPPEMTAAAAPGPLADSAARVLIVDDDENVRRLFERALRRRMPRRTSLPGRAAGSGSCQEGPTQPA